MIVVIFKILNLQFIILYSQLNTDTLYYDCEPFLELQITKKEIIMSKQTKPAKPKSGLLNSVDSNWKKFRAENPLKPQRIKRKSTGKIKKVEEINRTSVINPLTSELFKRREADGNKSISTIISIDCEMVGVGPDSKSALARVCIIDYDGEVVFDEFSRPAEEITDYRTTISGITFKDIFADDVKSVEEVCKVVRNLVKDKIIVGHSLNHDLKSLYIQHPRRLLRDTSSFVKFQKRSGGKMKLRDLALSELGWIIQEGEHDPYIDARAALEIYKKHEVHWEQTVKNKFSQRNKKKKEVQTNNHNKDIFSSKNSTSPRN